MIFITVLFSLILPIIGTVFAFVFILPEKRSAGHGPVMARLRDFLTMKQSYLVKILKVLYIVCTVFGTLSAFGATLSTCITTLGYSYYGWKVGGTILGIILGLIAGLLVAALSALLIRLLYENLLLLPSIAKNTSDLHQWFEERSGGRRSAPAPQPQSAPKPAVCRVCGLRYDPRRTRCPNGCDDR